MLDVTP